MSAQSGPRPIVSSLAVPLSPILGRQNELDQLLDLLDAGHRLVTITGPGGVGKTCLARHLAALLEAEFERDIVDVPLAAIPAVDLVLPTLAHALDLPTDSQEGLGQRVAQDLNERAPLVILDNLEHLLAVAPVIADLVARAPRASFVVTSQAPLGIRGEQRFPLEPLPVAAATAISAMTDSPAVALFIERARDIRPAFNPDPETVETIVSICRNLDGLPLAIELAAARIGILSPNALLARLNNRLQVLGSGDRDVPDRLRTMRHAIAWSYGLLPPLEQALFRQLAVFAGDVSFETVERVVAAGAPIPDLYQVFARLVDHSLLQTVTQPSGELRFRMLQSLRDYGLEQLDELHERDRAQTALVAWAVSLATDATPAMTGMDQQVWMERLDAEWDNLRAALGWALDHGQPQPVLHVFGAIWRFCSSREHISEARAMLARAFAATQPAPTREYVLALLADGYMADDQRAPGPSVGELFTQALDLATAMPDPLLAGQAELGLGLVDANRGAYPDALDHYERSLEYAQAAGDQRAISVALGNKAGVQYYTGAFAEAERHYQQCRTILKAIGDTQAESTALLNLGACATELGNIQEARVYLTEAVAITRAIANQRDLPIALGNLGEVWFFLGDYAQATTYFDEAISILRLSGADGMLSIVGVTAARVQVATGNLPAAASLLLEWVPVLEARDDLHTIALSTVVMAMICEATARLPEAAEAIGAGDRMRESLGMTLGAIDTADLGKTTEAVRHRLGRTAFAHHEAIGRERDLAAVCHAITGLCRVIASSADFPADSPPPSATPEGIPNPLTRREREVMRLLTEGANSREIADALFVSPRTATTHVENILRKLELSNRAAAVALALRNNWV